MSAYTLPRCAIGINHKGIFLHGFSDASKNAICARIYVSTTTKDGKGVQNLLVAKSRIAPKNQTIPRFELVASLILAKLMAHITDTLDCFTINRIVYWVDSMTVLYWLDNKGAWSQYVRNKVTKILELSKGDWKHVTTYQNPSDAGLRGTTKITVMWLKGPQWLQNERNWPKQTEIVQTNESTKEKVKEKSVIMVATENNTFMNDQFKRFRYTKLLRIVTWVKRFIYNCQQTPNRIGPLSTSEIESSERSLIIFVQKFSISIPQKSDEDQIWRCGGRIPNCNPIFIPKETSLARLIIDHYHKLCIHGGVSSTMCKIHERFWIPQLRSLMKKHI